MDCNIKMDNKKLKAKKKFPGVIFDHKLTNYRLRIILKIKLITPNTLYQLIIL